MTRDAIIYEPGTCGTLFLCVLVWETENRAEACRGEVENRTEASGYKLPRTTWRGNEKRAIHRKSGKSSWDTFS